MAVGALRLPGLALALVLMLAACAMLPPRHESPILIFSHTTGYRHASIEPGREALKALVEAEGATAVLSEDPDIFSGERLRAFSAIVLLNTTTDPRMPESEWLTGARRQALRQFVRSGGGVVGIHAAADSHYGWPWYGRMLGGRFRHHPAGTPTGRLSVVDGRHPVTRDLPAEHERADEWYYFDGFDPASRLLLTLDPVSIGEQDAAPKPVSWAREFEGGRIFYTALGHTPESYGDPYFLRHVGGGLRWAIGR